MEENNLNELDPSFAQPPPERGIFCNRTLNLRSLRAIGYDMDYTLIHYHIHAWEARAYEYVRLSLAGRGWPVQDLVFDPDLAIRGLIVDTRLGNVVKANRFGYIKRAYHGTCPLDFDTQRRTYSRTIIDLNDRRWVVHNTLFSLSRSCIYMQLVDLMDRQALPEVLGYAELYDTVRNTLSQAHMEGKLKGEIVAAPKRFVDLDPDTPAALLDQKEAGKKILLITNSDWAYTRAMMSYSFDRFLPAAMTWRELFDLVIISARKPEFFAGTSPVFEIVTEEGLLQSCPAGIQKSGIFMGGNASLVEEFLHCHGSDILYVGDHIYGDVHQSKNVRRWRTALILRELEAEIRELTEFRKEQAVLSELMGRKDEAEIQLARLRLAQQRAGRIGRSVPGETSAVLAKSIRRRQQEIARLDEEITPLARAAGQLLNPHWGLLMRTGNDKSYLARQVERHADIYSSRVSNFLVQTPFLSFRSHRGSLPHDPLSAQSWDEEESN
ncbi:MAG: HAD-IG family 5'-nucleotidase [Acidobacteria bacterium]|nr:HAD-IG family 5'-nucleotidase [Acidobacteriota bacterium]